MAEPVKAKTCLRWIADEEHIHRTADYGENCKSVGDALSEQQLRVGVVKEYNREVDKFVKTGKEEKDSKDEVLRAFDALKIVSEKRLGCLEDISQIAGLEEILGTVTVEFAKRTSELVAKETGRPVDIPAERDGEGIEAAAQNCILAVRNNWCWISKLVRCTDIHLKHASDYHQFFHEIAEYKHWMPIELNRASQKVLLSENVRNEEQEARKFALELKEMLTLFLHWQGKLDSLFERSKQIVPVHLRTKKLEFFRPVTSLCNYKTKEIHIQENEELLLMDNEQPLSWKVRSKNNVQADVPSVICLIPGPDPDAVDAAIKLRLELLGSWTLAVKRIGKNLIYFLVFLLRDWSEDEVKMLRAIPDAQKDEIRKILTFIEEVLVQYWGEYEGFKELHRRIQQLREILNQKGNAADRDPEATAILILQLELLQDLFRRFKDFWAYWQTFKVLVETTKHGELMLIVERWQQLKFLDIEELKKYWHAMNYDGDQSDFVSWMEWLRMMWEKRRDLLQHTMVEEVVETSMVEELGATEEVDAASTTMSQTMETATTDQLSHASQEEKKTFVITGVVDPRSKEEISMHQAVMLGVINSNNGTYNNPDTGDSMPIPVAMSQGLIKVEFTTTKRTEEKRRDVGLITIKTQKESRPYTVKAVIDAKTDKHLSVEEAKKAGILDQKQGIYHNTLTESDMSLADALDSGLLVVEFDSEAKVSDPEIVTKTYAIHGVVDQQLKKKVTFAEAVSKGLLDRDTGAYYHNVTGEQIYVGDAIQRGFIKASIVKDPKSLDIDPENQMVIEKVDRVRKKLKAVAALKKAASAEEHLGATARGSLSFPATDEATGVNAGRIYSADVALLARICKCALPLQILMLLLLGIASLVPMSEEDFGCALANNFEDSLSMMLKYKDGPPPS